MAIGEEQGCFGGVTRTTHRGLQMWEMSIFCMSVYVCTSYNTLQDTSQLSFPKMKIILIIILIVIIIIIKTYFVSREPGAVTVVYI